MTETLICASFVLVPLFLGIAILAKYIDIKQTAVQAARYQAWEYTVWYNSDSEMSTGFSAVTQPKKTVDFTRSETRRRFFTNPNDEINTLEIEATDGTRGWRAADRNHFWTDHMGNRLYSGTDAAGATIDSSGDTPTIPIIGDVMNLLMDILDWAFSAIGTLLSFVGSSAGFTAINTDGYATATTALAVPLDRRFIDTDVIASQITTNLVQPNNELIFTGRAGVLSDAWNAGGVEHVFNQAGGTIPTTLLRELLNAPVLGEIWDLITILAPELRRCHPTITLFGPDDKGSLWFGHIDIDAVHPDRLGDQSGSHSCNDAGMCDFDPPRDEDTMDCIP